MVLWDAAAASPAREVRHQAGYWLRVAARGEVFDRRLIAQVRLRGVHEALDDHWGGVFRYGGDDDIQARDQSVTEELPAGNTPSSPKVERPQGICTYAPRYPRPVDAEHGGGVFDRDRCGQHLRQFLHGYPRPGSALGTGGPAGQHLGCAGATVVAEELHFCGRQRNRIATWDGAERSVQLSEDFVTGQAGVVLGQERLQCWPRRCSHAAHTSLDMRLCAAQIFCLSAPDLKNALTAAEGGRISALPDAGAMGMHRAQRYDRSVTIAPPGSVPPSAARSRWALILLAVLLILNTALCVAALKRPAGPTVHSSAEHAAARGQLCDRYRLAEYAAGVESKSGNIALARIAATNGAFMLNQAAAEPALESRYRDAALALATALEDMTAVGSYKTSDDPDGQRAVASANAKNKAMKELCG